MEREGTGRYPPAESGLRTMDAQKFLEPSTFRLSNIQYDSTLSRYEVNPTKIH
jgi:hypothetical protein